MPSQLTIVDQSQLATQGQLTLPEIIAEAGKRAGRRFVEFFTAQIPNANTRVAYARAVADFCLWCQGRGLRLETITPVAVAAYLEGHPGSIPTRKQHLAAIHHMFDYLVTGNVLELNPAHSVRGPKHVVKKGKTPVLAPEDVRRLFDAIDISKIAGLRDRALLGTLFYSFARVGAVVAMNVEDYYLNGKRYWFRLHEKGGKFHEVPAHHTLEEYMDAYIEAAGIAGDRKRPLFRSLNTKRQLSRNRICRQRVLDMVKRRARQAGLPPERICCHTGRATGITAFLSNGGTVEGAQKIAPHESPRTTSLYDRTGDEISLDEIERVRF